MARAEILMPFTLSWEGGYVNHPNDKGGPTNKGITLATFQTFYGRYKTVGDLKRMTDVQWLHVFKAGYWDKCKGDQIESQAIANLIVDWMWGSGTTAIKRVQAVLCVTQDGIVGPKTLAVLNSRGTFSQLWQARKRHFEQCAARPGQSVFLKGWMNRQNSIEADRLLLNTYKYVQGVRMRKCVRWDGGAMTTGWER